MCYLLTGYKTRMSKPIVQGNSQMNVSKNRRQTEDGTPRVCGNVRWVSLEVPKRYRVLQTSVPEVV